MARFFYIPVVTDSEYLYMATKPYQAAVDVTRKTPPGDFAMWIFIMAELLVVAVFFPFTPLPGHRIPSRVMVKAIGVRPCTFIYLLLMAMTFFTWYGGVLHLGGLGFSLLVLGLSLLKGFLIGDYYMGLKNVASHWRWLIVGWLLIPGSLISYAFYLAS